MTHDEMIAVIQAHKEEKAIEYRASENAEWREWNEKWDGFAFNNYAYRIKPEPHYRPFKNADEVMEAIKKHGNWIHKKNSKFYSNSILIDGDIIDFAEGSCYAIQDTFKCYEFADGTPFGIKEE